MTPHSPIVAMLWELWRVTRVEAAWKLAMGVGVSLAAFIMSTVFGPLVVAEWDEGASIASVLLYLPHLVGWLSLAALNGGRPGFPLYLYYTRPIRTAVMVGIPTAYLTVLTFAIYLSSAVLLRWTSGYPFSVLPAAAWIAAVTSILRAIGWSVRSTAVATLGTLVALFGVGSIAGSRLDTYPGDVGYPLTDYAAIALIVLTCFGVTVATVARQRHGDLQGEAIARSPAGGLWWWLIDRFGFPCPTASATRAQVWMDLKSNGLPVLATGVALAIAVLLLGALGNPIDAAFADEIRANLSCTNEDCFYARAWPVILTPLALAFVLGLGRNAFGIRRKQGRAYLSAFEVTHGHGTAQLALLKVLVRSACVLAAIVAIGISAWMSVRLLGDPVFIQMWNVPLSSRLPAIAGAVVALSRFEQASLLVVAAVGVFTWVAALAAFGALRTRYSRRATIASILLLLYGLAFVWLAVGVRVDPDTARQFQMDIVYEAMQWIATAAIVVATVYVYWSGLAERVLTVRYASAVVAISAAFAAAWLTVLQIAGVQLAGMSAMNMVMAASPGLLSLLVSGLAPWSYSRARHT